MNKQTSKDLPGNISGGNEEVNFSIPLSEFSFSGNLDDNLINKIQKVFFWSATREGAEEKVAYSKNVTELTGYTPEEICSMPGRGMALIPEADLPEYKKTYFNFLNDPGAFSTSLTYRITRKDKGTLWISESISVQRDKSGNARLLNGIVTDITEFKNEQESLAASMEALKQTNDSKDKFLSILSHDLRAPFTSILGFSEILISESNLSPAERQEYLTYIHDSSQNQLQLINYLLDWTRLQTGRIKLDPVRLNAQTLVYNCISSLTGNAIRKNLDIKVYVDENLYVRADERLITQVITNLLSNAIKFSPEGKTIEVTADTFNDELIEFIVKDNGIGISDANKARLFKIDKMFSTEGTKGEKGTGLGLSLVKEIIEKHKGNIWFYSDQGKGSEFHLTVPSSLNTILVVENNPSDRVFFEKILKKFFPSFQVTVTDNGFEAVEVAVKKSPSLIVANHEMPLMSGLQLIESVRNEDFPRTPFIIMLSEDSDNIKMDYLKKGVKAVIQKPVDIDLFCSKIKEALHKF